MLPSQYETTNDKNGFTDKDIKKSTVISSKLDGYTEATIDNYQPKFAGSSLTIVIAATFYISVKRCSDFSFDSRFTQGLM